MSLSLSKDLIIKTKIKNLVLSEDMIDADSESVIGRRYDALTIDMIGRAKLAGFKDIDVVNVDWDDGLFLKSVKEDTTKTIDEALKDLYQKLRPGDPPTASARQMIKRLFFDEARFSLSRVGRYKIQQKLGVRANH